MKLWSLRIFMPNKMPNIRGSMKSQAMMRKSKTSNNRFCKNQIKKTMMDKTTINSILCQTKRKPAIELHYHSIKSNSLKKINNLEICILLIKIVLSNCGILIIISVKFEMSLSPPGSAVRSARRLSPPQAEELDFDFALRKAHRLQTDLAVISDELTKARLRLRRAEDF